MDQKAQPLGEASPAPPRMRPAAGRSDGERRAEYGHPVRAEQGAEHFGRGGAPALRECVEERLHQPRGLERDEQPTPSLVCAHTCGTPRGANTESPGPIVNRSSPTTTVYAPAST